MRKAKQYICDFPNISFDAISTSKKWTISAIHMAKTESIIETVTSIIVNTNIFTKVALFIMSCRINLPFQREK
jgi:hypothetical protein